MYCSTLVDSAKCLQVVPNEMQQRIVGALLHSLADKITGVACDAANALQQYGNSQEGQSPVNMHMHACKTHTYVWTDPDYQNMKDLVASMMLAMYPAFHYSKASGTRHVASQHSICSTQTVLIVQQCKVQHAGC